MPLKKRFSFKALAIPKGYDKGIILWGITAFFYFFQFILRVSPSACADNIMVSLSIDAKTLGAIIGLYYTGYTLMQIPAGAILDRIGTRLPVTLGMIMCSSGVFLFAFAQSTTILSIARFMMGLGSAFALLSNIKIVSVWFRPQVMSVFVGLTLLMGTLGAIIGGAPLTLLLDSIGWKKTLITLSCLGFIHAVISWYVLGAYNTAQTVSEKKQLNGFSTLLSAFFHTLKSPFTYMIGMFGLLMYLPLSGFCDLWGASFIEDVYGINRITAAAIPSFVYIGMGVGAPLWPLLHTRVQNYGLELMSSAFLTCLCFAIAFYVSLSNLWVLKSILFLGGVALSGQFLAYGLVTQYNCVSRTGIATGIHNMMCMASGMIAQPLIGFFMDRHGRLEGVSGIVYARQAYMSGFSVIILGLLGAMVTIYLARSYLAQLDAQPEAQVKEEGEG